MSVEFLVLGATGRVGSLVVRELAAAGRRVGGLVRDPARAMELWPEEVRAVAGDLADAASVRAAMRGVQAVPGSRPGAPASSRPSPASIARPRRRPRCCIRRARPGSRRA